jgi:hypothetical protein
MQKLQALGGAESLAHDIGAYTATGDPEAMKRIQTTFQYMTPAERVSISRYFQPFSPAQEGSAEAQRFAQLQGAWGVKGVSGDPRLPGSSTGANRNAPTKAMPVPPQPAQGQPTQGQPAQGQPAAPNQNTAAIVKSSDTELAGYPDTLAKFAKVGGTQKVVDSFFSFVQSGAKESLQVLQQLASSLGMIERSVFKGKLKELQPQFASDPAALKRFEQLLAIM